MDEQKLFYEEPNEAQETKKGKVKKRLKKIGKGLETYGPAIGAGLLSLAGVLGFAYSKSLSRTKQPKSKQWTEEEARDLTCAAAKALSGLGYIGPDRGVVITTDPLGNYMAEPVTRRKE